MIMITPARRSPLAARRSPLFTRSPLAAQSGEALGGCGGFFYFARAHMASRFARFAASPSSIATATAHQSARVRSAARVERDGTPSAHSDAHESTTRLHPVALRRRDRAARSPRPAAAGEESPASESQRRSAPPVFSGADLAGWSAAEINGRARRATRVHAAGTTGEARRGHQRHRGRCPFRARPGAGGAQAAARCGCVAGLYRVS